MERKNERLPIFTERFRELQGDRSNTEFADFLGISRQTVGFYCNGDRVPDALTLVKIAKKCEVSSDWLLGLTGDKSTKFRTTDVLGISSNALDSLIEICNHSSDIVSDLFSSIGFTAFLCKIHLLKQMVHEVKQAHSVVHEKGLCKNYKNTNVLMQFEEWMGEFLGYPVHFEEPKHSINYIFEDIKLIAENLAKELSGYNDLTSAELDDHICDFEEKDIKEFLNYITERYYTEDG